jgi:NCS1 nucleoside transporter family
MTQRAKKKLIEQRCIDYVPIKERHGKVWHLAPVWFSGNAQLATVATGAVGVLLGGSLAWMIIAVLLGCALGTFFMSFHSTQGPQLGLPQMIQSRPQFGYVGALLVWGVALIAYIGFNSFNQILAVQTVQSVYGGNATAIMLVFTIVSLGVAIIGYDLIHLAQRWIAGIMIVVLLVFSLAALQLHLPTGQTMLGDFRIVPFLAQVFAAAAYLLSWSIYVSDYSRYLPKTVSVRASFWWTYVGCFSGGAWMMLLGTLAAALYPHLDVATGLQTMTNSLLPGFGKPLLMISLLGLVTMTSLNFYGAALTLVSVANSIRPNKRTVTKRVLAMLISAIIATGFALMASSNFIGEFSSYLSILLYLFTPWTAINLIDFYIVRSGHYSVREIFNPHGMYARWNWRGLTAYGLGFIAMIPFFSTSFYTGPIAQALGGTDISMVVGLPVSAIVYLLACRSLNIEEDKRRAYIADIGLDPDINYNGIGLPSQKATIFEAAIRS